MEKIEEGTGGKGLPLQIVSDFEQRGAYCKESKLAKPARGRGEGRKASSSRARPSQALIKADGT